ncbi:MAG: YggS family pyridoxal phosphate-dependent enzyme [Candidatus Eremiobacteraeota bacterium]|nr:YggS family pyridoxal phosphate-dependent enzyme [Candidatus Eremiobacteraeota bacterium]
MKLEIGASPDGSPNSLAGSIASMRERIAEAACGCGRLPGGIVLVGVTKKHARDTVVSAIEGGLNDIAENYVQEARAKLDGLPPVRKHFIGHVQTNKAKAIVEMFDVVQSVDRLEAGRAIARAARTLGKPVRALLQINISPSERFGVDPADAPALAARLRDDEGLPIDGVMAIGPLTDDGDEVARAFERAAETFGRVGGETLSIGMSGDWEQAIRSGSTMLRIGTALFGARTDA